MTRVLRLPFLLLLLAACQSPGDASDSARIASDAGVDAVRATDDAGRSVVLAAPAQRVLSLLPSGTDLVTAIAGPGRLVGRTRYDEDPVLAALPSVGGGLDPSVEAIVALHPDLVILWGGATPAPIRESLDRAGLTTFALHTADTSDVFSAMNRLGRLLGRDSAAAALAAQVRAQLDSVHRSVASRPEATVFYVAQLTPPMTTSPTTFVGQLLGVAGARSVFPELTGDWQTVSMEELVRRDPQLIIVPTSGDPASRIQTIRATPGWRELGAVRQGRVIGVPAALLDRPGPRLGEAAAALAQAITQAQLQR